MAEYNFQLWPEWKVVKKIGGGSFGNVYEIHRRNGNYIERAALKVIRIPSNPNELLVLRQEGLQADRTEEYLARHVDEIRNEIGVMQKFVGYSNIVSYEDYLIRKHANDIGWDILIRMELLTPLSSYMLSNPMSEKLVLKIGMDISQALVILHGGGVIHRDIKPQNIFINERGFFKLGDFGISRSLPQTGGIMSFKGTVSYMAPETFAMRGTDARSDIYSLALVLHRCLNGGREPLLTTAAFTPEQKEEAQHRRLIGTRLPAPAYASKATAQVLAVALDPNPDARYQTAAQFYQALAGVAAAVGGGSVQTIPQQSGKSKGSTGSSWRRSNTGTGSRSAALSVTPTSPVIAGSTRNMPVQPAKTAGTGNKRAIAASNTAGRTYSSSGRNMKKRILACCGIAAVGLLAGTAIWMSSGGGGSSKTKSPGSMGVQTIQETPENTAGQTDTFTAGDPSKGLKHSTNTTTETRNIGYTGEDALDEIAFADPVLEKAIQEQLNLKGKPVTVGDAVNVFKLDLDGELKGEEEKITDLTGLSAFENLEELNLSNNLITNVEELEGMVNLYQLDLGENRILDVTPLENLTSLTYLDLMDNEIETISPLSSLSGLWILDVSGNLLTDLDGCRGLSSLAAFIGDRNQISDLGPLSSLKDLMYLVMRDNQITDLEPIKGLTGLVELVLGENDIREIGVLKGMKDLNILDLHDNEIEDISVLKELPELTDVAVFGNPIDDDSPLEELPPSVTIYQY